MANVCICPRFFLVALILLAVRAIVTAATGDNNPLDWSFAHQARFALTAVDPVLQLEEAFLAVGIHVVANGRAAQRDSFVENFLQRSMQLAQLLTW